jgi:hypothetical protein
MREEGVCAQLQKLYEFVGSKFAEQLNVTAANNIRCHSSAGERSIQRLDR